jgi:hypothetical protein
MTPAQKIASGDRLRKEIDRIIHEGGRRDEFEFLSAQLAQYKDWLAKLI